MKINLNDIINNKKIQIQEIIKEKELELDNINKAYEELAEFLLENGYEVKNEGEDLLSNVISIIDKLKENLLLNEKDIEYIKESMESLKNIKTHLLDASVTESLELKIKEIKDEIDYNNQKILYINEYIEILEEIKSTCPLCKSKNNKCRLCLGNEVTIKEILNYENNKEIPKTKAIKVEEVFENKVEEKVKETAEEKVEETIEVKPIEEKEEIKEEIVPTINIIEDNKIVNVNKEIISEIKEEVVKVNTYKQEQPQSNMNMQQNYNQYKPQQNQHNQGLTNNYNHNNNHNNNNKPTMVKPIVIESNTTNNQNQYQNYQQNNDNMYNNHNKNNNYNNQYYQGQGYNQYKK